VISTPPNLIPDLLCTGLTSCALWGQAGGGDQQQRGVLRSNCIDCLDRTNVAQFAFGLVALGRQLEALSVADAPRLDPRSSIAAQLVDLYEAAGNTLARQVLGSRLTTVC